MSSGQEKSHLSNIDAVILALYKLGGDQQAIDTEDIAMAADRIAPGQFRWRKYPDQVNLDTARAALKDALRPELVRGGVESGWTLNAAGLDWVRKNSQAGVRTKGRQRLDRQAQRRQQAERARIRSLPVFAKFWKGEATSRREAESLFRIDDYSSPDRKLQATERLRALFVQDEDMLCLIEAMAALVLGPIRERNDESANS